MSNWGFIHPNCGPEPGRYNNVPVEAFFGHNIQLKFETPDGRGERMWVFVHGPAETPGQELLGEVTNDPIYAVGWPAGSLLEFCRSEIIKVDIIDLPPSPYQGNPNYRRNMDEGRRKEERRASAGDIEAQTKVLHKRVQAGELASWVPDTLAFLGYPPALPLVDRPSNSMAIPHIWMRRLNRTIPEIYQLSRHEIRFRVAIAAAHKLVSLDADEEYLPTQAFLEEVLATLERVFLEGTYGKQGRITQEFTNGYATLYHQLHGVATGQDYPIVHDEKAIVILALSEAIHIYYCSADDKTVNDPKELNTRVLQITDQNLPVGTGQSLSQIIAGELIPWLLGQGDPILARHPDALQ